MSVEETKALQQRLADARCYAGAINGVVSNALATAIKSCPDQEPILRVETGEHSAPVFRIGVDAQCRLAATASEDKTVRLWSLPDGKPLRVLRPPIDSGDYGKLYAIAVSPDGRFVATGGIDAHAKIDGRTAVSIFDAASGNLVARIGSYEKAVHHLVFSRDGRWLAVMLGRSAGLRVIDAASWREVAADRNYGDESEGGDFGPDGRLYTIASDDKIRIYGPGPQFRRQAAIDGRGGKELFSISVDPQGERFAVGFYDTTEVDLYDAASLAFLTAADTRGIDNGNLSEVAWRADGKALLAGGHFYDQAGNRPLLIFDRDGRRLEDPPTALAKDTIMHVAPCGDGFAVSTSDAAFGLLDGSGRKRFWRRGVGADMRFKVADNFTVSNDAKGVRFGLGVGAEQPVFFDLRRASLDDASKSPPGLTPPDVADLPISNWFNQPNPIFNGRTIVLKPHETSRSLAIRPGGRGFVLGTEWNLRAFVPGGGWVNPAPSPAWGVNISPDDRLVVAAYGDGTIRWHRVDNGRELLALFVNRETKAWVAWTPSGYYMASPGGEDLIGWHVNRGWDQSADFFPASRFRDRFNRPDVVELVLDTLDEDAAVRQADAKAHRREETKPLVAELPPLIRISDPPDGGRVAAAQTKLDYVWRSPSGLPVEAIEVQIDGRRVKEETLPVRPADANAEVKGSLEIALPPHDVEVGLIAYSGDIKSEVAAVKLTWTGPVPPTAPPRHLHALIAGVSDYAAPEMALAYAAKDARDFAHALESQKGGYYADVETRVIVDREVTRASLIDGLDWLSKQAGPDDVSVLFLAGHGVTDETLTYWYLPSDATEEQAHGKGLSQDDVQRALRSVAGRVIWFLDTCHAGGATTRSAVDVNRLVNTVTSAESGGIVAFASSKGNETSFESSVWKNGAFTKALVEGIENGKAAVFGQEAIKIKLLEEYLEVRVGELTENEQTPTMQLPPQVADFVIAVAKKKP